jgi:hypothetical protein
MYFILFSNPSGLRADDIHGTPGAYRASGFSGGLDFQNPGPNDLIIQYAQANERNCPTQLLETFEMTGRIKSYICGDICFVEIVTDDRKVFTYFPGESFPENFYSEEDNNPYYGRRGVFTIERYRTLVFYSEEGECAVALVIKNHVFD